MKTQRSEAGSDASPTREPDSGGGGVRFVGCICFWLWPFGRSGWTESGGAIDGGEVWGGCVGEGGVLCGATLGSAGPSSRTAL